ncbi:MAG: hypothetical protein U5L04_01260 [Trueperaceae bacterium]|nr:hypothetical protein [Trueperaceae bacterium]
MIERAPAMAAAFCPASLASGTYSGDKQPGEDADDRDGNQHLNQGEASRAGEASRSLSEVD